MQQNVHKLDGTEVEKSRLFVSVFSFVLLVELSTIDFLMSLMLFRLLLAQFSELLRRLFRELLLSDFFFGVCFSLRRRRGCVRMGTQDLRSCKRQKENLSQSYQHFFQTFGMN